MAGHGITPVNVLSHGAQTFGELSVNASGIIELHPHGGAGIWALIAANATDLNTLKTPGPASTAAAVAFSNTADPGVDAESKLGSAIVARAHAKGTIGIHATHDGDQSCTAISGESTAGRGVSGFSQTWQGVYGHSVSQAGVVGESQSFDGVFGISHDPKHAGVSGHNPGGMAGFFDGDVLVTGDVVLTGADCAEQFDVSNSVSIDPGMVMSIRDDGSLGVCEVPYDRRVAGVVSGAGSFRPGIILDKQAQETGRRKAVALVGKVFCWADAEFAPIETGDLLTTSATPGHAMKASDRGSSFGAVLGKALRPLKEGRALIPVLIALQ